MKTGKFFQIPETSDDVALFRSRAVNIVESTRPEWLELSDLDYYLYLGSVKVSYKSTIDLETFKSEIEEIQGAEVVVDQNRKDPSVWRIYVTAKPLYDDWSIGIFIGDSPLRLHDSNLVINPVISRQDISDVEAAFVADPFMLKHEGYWYMFFEILNWRDNKGEIGLAISKNGFSWKYEKRVLVESFHLSYPYVFCSGKEFYMLPETKQSGAIRLYRAENFPDKWTLINKCLEGENLVDSSIFFAECWWILAATSDANRIFHMRLFYSETLEGPWREHPESPFHENLSTDIRPAGRVLVNDGRIIRFAQNRSGDYGTSVRAYEITRLTRDSYAEETVSEMTILGPISSRWAASGMHHLDAHQTQNSSWIACVDGRS